MATIETIQLPSDGGLHAMWAGAAASVAAWLRERALPARDAVLLLPFAALLPVARAAFAAEPGFAGWPPRVETPLTLAAALGPVPELPSGRASGDLLVDRLVAASRVRRVLAAADLATAAPGDVDHLAALFVQAAQRVRAAALARPPAERAAYFEAARVCTAGAAGGPAQLEARLLREAVAWCAEGVAAASDRLFEHRPAAWIALEIGGADALAQGVIDAAATAGTPALRLVADPDAAAPFAALARPPLAERWLVDDAEDEARAAAGAVIEALNAGRTPVALVALDRSLVRRARALLERAGVPLADETGWQLSTTRAAARLLALLRAAQSGPGSDAWLDWLATWPPADAGALRSLEAEWRRRRRVPDRDAARRLARDSGVHLAPLAEPGRRSLREWLRRLAERLQRDGSRDALAADAAGAQVLVALRLDDDEAAATLGGEADTLQLDLAGFAAWVAAALEEVNFVPPAGAGAEVVITPMARAVGRPFGHIVLPAADHRHLGHAAPSPSLIGEALAAELGLETREAARQHQRLALAQLMRAPALTMLRRRQDEGEGVDDSPDVQWLLLEAARAGAPPWPLEPAPVPQRELAAAAVPRPAPQAADALPPALSATQIEALRDCPYRFFARAVLLLDEPAELELGLAKRDYGEWLHRVLDLFHRGRAAPGAADEGLADDARLERAAQHATAEQQLDEADLLPFRASFEVFAPAYLQWLAEREARGWRWIEGEADKAATPPALAPTTLRGRLDRLDAGPQGARQVIDYKTGSAGELKRKAAQGPEDTQLAFYAALLGDDAVAAAAEGAPPLQACYLALDARDAPIELAHTDVQRSAAVLVAGLAGELQRLREGAPLHALGEGELCDRCEARGLCRRDHWAAAPAAESP